MQSTPTSTNHSEYDRDALVAISSHETLPPAVQQKLIERAQAGDAQAAEKVVANNMRLVMNRVSENRNHLGAFVPGGAEYTDLFNEGAIGLHNAVADYDPSRGSFAAWAITKIDTQIKQALRREEAIKLPAEVVQLRRAIYRLQTEREDAGLRPLSTAQLATHFGKSEQRILDIQQAGVVVTSLQTTLESGDELGSMLAEKTVDPASLTDEQAEARQFELPTLEELLAKIPPSKAGVLREHLIDGKSIKEIAECSATSSTTVGKNVKVGMAMLRKAARQHESQGAARPAAGAQNALARGLTPRPLGGAAI